MRTKVLLAATLLVGFAASAQAATIVGTKHDLSSSQTGSSIHSLDQNQTCVFCHVPHNAITNKLLWNRTNTLATFKVYTSYNTGAMRTAFSANQLAADSSSLLCLSCHSLATAAEVVSTNTGNSKGGADSGKTGNWAQAGLGADLTNDHPVGINYGNSAITATDFNLASGGKVGVLRLFKSTVDPANTMECATCHSVHDNSNGKFLANTNAQSALCVICHKK